MLSHFRSVHPFARLKNAEVIAQLVGEHSSYGRIDRNALVLEGADDSIQIKLLVPIVDQQHGADGKRFILVQRDMTFVLSFICFCRTQTKLRNSEFLSGPAIIRVRNKLPPC